MKTFKEYINETLSFEKIFLENKEIFDKFLELLSDYMDLSDKSVIDELYKLTLGTSLITDNKKVFRVMCTDDIENIDFGTRKMISASVSKVKGKVLDNIISDMTDRYKRHKHMSECKLVYVELNDVKGINISELIKEGLKKGTKLNIYLDDEYLDMFKRLKSEKEFLVINNDIKINKVSIIKDR